MDIPCAAIKNTNHVDVGLLTIAVPFKKDRARDGVISDLDRRIQTRGHIQINVVHVARRDVGIRQNDGCGVSTRSGVKNQVHRVRCYRALCRSRRAQCADRGRLIRIANRRNSLPDNSPSVDAIADQAHTLPGLGEHESRLPD